MKHLCGIFAALAAVGTAVAQPIGTAVVVGEGHVTAPDNYRVYDMLKAPNGDLVFIAGVENTERSLAIVRTTSTGTPLWTRTFTNPNGSGDIVGMAGDIGADGKIYIVCTMDSTTSRQDFYYLELNSIGVKLNDRIVDHYDNDSRVGGIKVAPDGSVYFSGGGSDIGDRPLLVKMDASLTPIWAHEMGNAAGTGIQEPGGLDVAADNSVVASAVTHDGFQFDVQFVRRQPNGTQVYEKILGDASLPDSDPKVMIGSNGLTYFTYTRSEFTNNVQARLSCYDASGVIQWNLQEPGYRSTQFCEGSFGLFYFATSQADSPYSTKYFQFDGFGNVLWNRTMSHTGLDFNDMVKLSADDNDRLYSMSYVGKTGVVGGDWLVANLTNSGVPLYEWSFDTGVNCYDIPTGMQPIGNNEVVVTGFSNSSSGSDMHTYRLAPILVVNPTSATVRLGRRNAGNLDSLKADDNDYYEVCKFIVPNQTVAPVNVEFDSTIPADYPIGTVNFDTVVKANTPGLQQDTQLWNYLKNGWDTSVFTTLTLSEAATTVPGLPDPNVEGTTRNVKARIRVKQVGPVTVNLWCVQIDKAVWRVTP